MGAKSDMFSSDTPPQHSPNLSVAPDSISIPSAVGFKCEDDAPTSATLSPISPSTPFQGEASVPSHLPRPKQKRNKPTLSCGECVERKTKCDRNRPVCMACVKRQTNCEYSTIANMLVSPEFGSEKPSKIRRMSKHSAVASEAMPMRYSIKDITQPPPPAPVSTSKHLQEPQSALRTESVSSSQSPRSPREPTYHPRPTIHLTSLSMDNSAPISIFGIGREHPFGNYWTSNGGLAEVVAILPSKQQADILMTTFFEIVDPMYPVIDRFEVMSGYQHFWALSAEDRRHYDPTTLALHLVLYANATLFIERGEPAERIRTAEFYISAAHQALRLGSYWSHISLTTAMAMCMTFHFLVNDNHVHDAWAFAGIMSRQSQVLQLYRDPELIVPQASAYEKAMRLKLWTLIMFQDTGISLFLKLPPNSIYTDITADSFGVADGEHNSPPPDPRLSSYPIPMLNEDARKNDLGFLSCVWKIGDFMQKNICIPRSLGQHICRSIEHRMALVQSFRRLWDTFPSPFNSRHPDRFMNNNTRLAKQLIYLSNNFFHPMMLILSDVNPLTGVEMDVFGTLEAAHEALSAFFAMHDMFGSELNGFWAMQHRSFEVSLTMANLLAKVQESSSRPEIPAYSATMASASWLLARIKEDVRRMLDVIRASSGYFEFQTMETTRLDALRSVFQKISIS